MAQFEPLVGDIEDAHAQLVYIAAEKRHGVFRPARFLEKHPVSFPFLLDEDRAVTRAYGLYHRLGTDAIRVAHPATLLIDRSGWVQYIYRGANQADRAAVAQVMIVLKSLS